MQWQRKIGINKWWVIGAIATPALIGMMWWLWLLCDRRLQPDGDRLSHNERATLAYPRRETLISGMGAIVMVAGGVFLLLNFRRANRNTETPDLSGALLFFVNSRQVQNLEPLQLQAQPSPFLCNVALPSYSHQRKVNPNRDCDRIP